MIVVANAVINPRAVVIISLNASIADVAVTRSISANKLTVRAEQDWIKFIKQIAECNCFGWMNSTWIFQHGKHHKYQSKKYQTYINKRHDCAFSVQREDVEDKCHVD